MLCNQDRNWEVLETSKNKVDQFRRTMPLISDLKNQAMRPRHWEQIQVFNQSQDVRKMQIGLF